MAAEQPSSDNGATYKRLLSRSLREFDRALSYEIGGVRAATAGRTARARKRFAGASRMHRLARRHERRAQSGDGRPDSSRPRALRQGEPAARPGTTA